MKITIFKHTTDGKTSYSWYLLQGLKEAKEDFAIDLALTIFNSGEDIENVTLHKDDKLIHSCI